MGEMARNDSGEASARQSDAGPPEDDDATQLDVAFGILQNERRRRVLRYLRDHPTTTQGDLAEHVAAIENGVPPGSLTSTQRKRVYVSLYQSHLPKLDDVDAIDYDPNRGTVARTPVTDEFLSYLERAEGTPGQSDGFEGPTRPRRRGPPRRRARRHPRGRARLPDRPRLRVRLRVDRLRERPPDPWLQAVTAAPLTSPARHSP